MQPKEEWVKRETEMDQKGSQKGWLIFLTTPRSHVA